MFEKEALKTKGPRKRMLSRIMLDDSFFGSDEIPTSKLTATIPKKKKEKQKEKNKDKTVGSPEPKAGYTSQVMKAVSSVLNKISELAEELQDSVDKKDKGSIKK